MSENTTPWRDLHEFTSVDLEESFVLSWKIDGESLLIDVDLFLCADHIFYEKPRPSEGACFRPAAIEFRNCTSLRGNNLKDELAGTEDTTTALGLGKIHDLRRTGEGEYKMSGEFGDVDIAGDRPIVWLMGSGG